jgi:hypothetical protein
MAESGRMVNKKRRHNRQSAREVIPIYALEAPPVLLGGPNSVFLAFFKMNLSSTEKTESLWQSSLMQDVQLMLPNFDKHVSLFGVFDGLPIIISLLPSSSP